MGSDIVLNLRRPPIPPGSRSRIPNRTKIGLTPRSSTPPAGSVSRVIQELQFPSEGNLRFGFRGGKPSSLPSLLGPSPSSSSSQMSSAIPLSTSTSTDNKNKSAIYKRSHGQQQRKEQEKEQQIQPHFSPEEEEEGYNNPSSTTVRQHAPSSSQSLSLPPSSLSVAELATKFLQENVRNCYIKPRIFPMESTSFPCERVPTPFVFSSEATRIHQLHHRRQLLGLGDARNKLLLLKSSEDTTRTTATTAATAVISGSRSCAAVTTSWLQRVSMMSNCVNSSPHLGTNGKNNSFPRNTTHTQQNSQRSDFASVLKKWNPPIPPALSRKLGRGSESPLGKVKVMLRVCENPEESGGPGILGVDPRRKQVTLIDPGGTGPNGITLEERRVIGVSAPKMFAFDGIFGEEFSDDDQGEICSASAAELVACVLAGEDGCLVSLGYSNPGKRQTMFGKPSNQKLGVVPTAISWLFKCIHEQKQKTGSRFSVRVSALEVTGGSVHETITDLLLPFANDGDQPPGAYLLDGNGSAVNGHKGLTSGKSVTSNVLSSVSEVRAPNPETAGFYLDSALDAINAKEESGGSGGHFVFTLHVYQYSIDKNGKGVVGGRSRLHCVLLGNGSPSISVLSGLLLAVLNGQRHLPSSNHSKLGAILRECLGSLTCRAVVMIHISNSHTRYAEALAALQLGSRVHRLRRSRRLKMGSVGSGTGSGGSSGGSGEEMRNGGPGTSCNLVGEVETGSSDIDPSSSEQSCDTVIYLGPSIDEATDGEHPPVYLPSLDNTENGTNSKIVPSKCPPLNTSLNGPLPKTKSPKPKSSNKILSEGPYSPGINGVGAKSEEKWIDGPKVPKHRQLQNHLPSSSQSSAPKSKGGGETWIDGPAARVNHQASNFPSPKKSVTAHSHQQKGAVTRGLAGPVPNGPSDPCCMTSTKTEMIQKWISNQTNSPTFFDDISQLDESFGGQNGHIFSVGGPSSLFHPGQKVPNNFHPYFLGNGSGGGDPVFNSFCPEPEYKSLTVFKTCEDDENDVGRDEGYEFEFIEVVEPEVPVPTNDVCLQVTEEDIALSFLGENPLPESDQRSGPGFFDRIRSSSFSDCPNELGSYHSFPTLDKSEHPLRVLSQECLTVVSTFTDSMSVNGEIERFLQLNSFHNHENHDVCNGLCKNLATLSQMSLDHLNDYPYESITPFTANSTAANGKAPSDYSSLPRNMISNGNNKPVLQEPPILSTEVFKIPPTPNKRISSLTSHSRKSSGAKDSDCEDSVVIPPMDLIDVNPIKSNCHPNVIDNQQPQGVVKQPPLCVKLPVQQNGCDHNHSTANVNVGITPNQNGNSNTSASLSTGSTLSLHSSSPSQSQPDASPPQSLSPVVIPIQISETNNGKSPSKSKARKIARFFRSRSKSPKKVLSVSGATSSGESGKSSGSTSESKHSSSASSCSSGASLPSTASDSSNNNSKQKQHSSPKHHASPSKKQSLKVHPSFASPPTNGTDYTFTCDSSALPLFLPKPSTKISVDQSHKK